MAKRKNNPIWDDAEDDLLERLVQKHTYRWAVIARELASAGYPLREPEACRQHYNAIRKRREPVMPNEFEILALHTAWR